ncbi:MAG: glutaredoxin 3 [Gammaproteobacteria bacterium]
MPDVIIYTTKICPYCIMAKRLLDRKGVGYTEINVDAEPGLREQLMRKTRRRTVPQIFIDDRHIGGFDDLYALDQLHQLDPLLGLSPET